MEEIELLRRKLKRQVAARLEAERLLEERSRELYDNGQKLEKLNSTLGARVAAGTLQLQRANAMLTTLHETVLMAAEVETFDEALERCLKAICQMTGWPLGHIYKRLNDDDDILLPSGIWFIEKPALFNDFRELTEMTTVAKGVGLAGRIWESGAPVWVDDVKRDRNFLSAKTGGELNVRCCFGFPVTIKGRLAAVLEFFNDEVFERDDDLVALLGSVGEQVGRVLERQESHREQKAAREDADRANQAKSRFLANMSHEIRTPMNAILGLTELVLDGKVTDTQREYLSTVLASGESLLSLVNDILDLSKIEADAVTLERTVVNLHDIAFSVMRSMATQAHVKELELLCSLTADVPEFIYGDKTRMQQIFINLIGNAIKFTQHGEVELMIDAVKFESDERGLDFTIRDTGIGIPKEKERSIFTEFEQADASTTRQFGGTGLGLSIVSRLVGLMNGEIHVDSTVGVGSKIGFSINESYYGGIVADELVAARAQDSIYDFVAGESFTSLAGCCFTLIDGNLRHQEIFADWITRFGGSISLARTLQEASQHLPVSGLSGSDKHFVFIDSRVVDDSGFDAVRELMIQAPDATKFLVMLDSTTHWQETSQAGRLKFCGQLRKPLKCAEVVNLICKLKKVEGSPRRTDTVSIEIGSGAVRRLTVLVAEDSVVNQKLAVAMLQKLGHEVVIANHGKEALASIAKQDFDLVLMDIQMPEMDGFETVRRLRQTEGQNRLPVIALTANAMRGDRDACLEAGMDAYLSKPIRLQKLADAIHQVCIAD